MSASTIKVDGVVTTVSSQGSSSGKGKYDGSGEATADGKESGKGTTSSQGENSGSTTVTTSGGGGKSTVTTTTSGKGRTGGSGAYTSTAGDASVTSKGSDQSEGKTSTTWKDIAFGGGSWGRGNVTTGGSQSGTAEVAPEGSSARQTTSGTGSHDLSGGTTLARYNPNNGALVATDVTGYSSIAGGSTTSAAAAKDGVLTESSTGGSNGGTAVNFSQSKGDDGQYIHSNYNKTTTTSNTKDGTFTGTDTHEWDNQSESSWYNIDAVTSSLFAATFGSNQDWSKGSATETVTHSAARSSASSKSNAQGGSSSETVSFSDYVTPTYTGNESYVETALTRTGTTGDWKSSSSYSSSHENGPFGAKGGKFDSSSSYEQSSESYLTSERGSQGSDIQHTGNGYSIQYDDLYSGSQGLGDADGAVKGSASDTSKYQSHSSDKGTYEDTARGRLETGKQTTTNKSQGKFSVDRWDETYFNYYSPDELMATGEWHFQRGTTDSSTTEVSYSPSGSSSKTSSSSSNKEQRSTVVENYAEYGPGSGNNHRIIERWEQEQSNQTRVDDGEVTGRIRRWGQTTDYSQSPEVVTPHSGNFNVPYPDTSTAQQAQIGGATQGTTPGPAQASRFVRVDAGDRSWTEWYQNGGLNPFTTREELEKGVQLDRLLQAASQKEGDPQNASSQNAPDAEQEQQSALDQVQSALGWAGFLPGPLGFVSDLANAGVSALRGNYTDAAISVVASLPIVGDAAKLALKPIVAAAGSTVNAAAGVVGAALKKLDDKVDDVPFSGGGNAVVDEAKDNLARNRRIGEQGERSSNTVKNTQRIPSTSRPGQYRIPDGLDEVSLTEIKNVAKLSNTSQLRDFLEHAKNTNRTFVLETRQSTKISGPLQDLINRGLIDHRIIGR